MNVRINGRTEAIDSGTIADLILRKGFKPDRLVVEHNRSIIPQESWSSVRLQEGDTLELLSFVGGG